MTEKTYYLTEPITRVYSNTKLVGTSLRTYEITFTPRKTEGQYVNYTIPFTPTGNVFVIKNDKIVKQKTKAKLTNKTIRQRPEEEVITSFPDFVSAYYCSIFSSPELALHTKIAQLSTAKRSVILDSSGQINVLKDRIEKLQDLDTKKELLSKFKAENPEFFI